MIHYAIPCWNYTNSFYQYILFGYIKSRYSCLMLQTKHFGGNFGFQTNSQDKKEICSDKYLTYRRYIVALCPNQTLERDSGPCYLYSLFILEYYKTIFEIVGIHFSGSLNLIKSTKLLTISLAFSIWLLISSEFTTAHDFWIKVSNQGF